MPPPLTDQESSALEKVGGYGGFHRLRRGYPGSLGLRNTLLPMRRQLAVLGVVANAALTRRW